MPALQLPQKSASVRARQVQRSVADVVELRDVQVHSERHCDLMVRINGCSAAFVDMADPAQDEIIRREEMIV